MPTPRDDIVAVLNHHAKAVRVGLFEVQRHSTKTDPFFGEDTRHGQGAFDAWEQAEPGSIADMLITYRYIFDPNQDRLSQPLSINYINDVRSQMRHGSTDGYGSMEFDVNRGINGLNVEDQDVFRSDHLDGRGFWIGRRSSYQEVQHNAVTLRQDLQSGGYLNATVTEGPYGSSEQAEGVRILACGKDSKKYYQAIIARYNHKMGEITGNSASEADQKLETIIEMVRDLELVHPYQDFNCRTFCTLVLNRELVKNGMSPSLMEDPNVFDYQSMGDLKLSVLVGQINFAHLQRSPKDVVHPGDPTNQMWLQYMQEKRQDCGERGEIYDASSIQTLLTLVPRLNTRQQASERSSAIASSPQRQPILEELMAELEHTERRVDEQLHRIEQSPSPVSRHRPPQTPAKATTSALSALEELAQQGTPQRSDALLPDRATLVALAAELESSLSRQRRRRAEQSPAAASRDSHAQTPERVGALSLDALAEQRTPQRSSAIASSPQRQPTIEELAVELEHSVSRFEAQQRRRAEQSPAAASSDHSHSPDTNLMRARFQSSQSSSSSISTPDTPGSRLLVPQDKRGR